MTLEEFFKLKPGDLVYTSMGSAVKPCLVETFYKDRFYKGVPIAVLVYVNSKGHIVKTFRKAKSLVLPMK